MRLHLVIHGTVQGVFFRDYVKKTADFLKLKGWVRNRPDSTVEVVAEGEKENLKQLLEKCRQGPQLAEVKKIEKEWIDGKEEFNDFRIK